jgi:hypothetical protein
MRSTPRLLEAIPQGGYTVHLRFEDGTEADVDLGYLAHLGGVFDPLGDAEYFRRLRIYSEGQTVYWPRDPAMPEGEEYEDIASVQADIAPETLYAHTRRAASLTA